MGFNKCLKFFPQLSKTIVVCVCYLIDEGNANMAKPEFEGLWDKHKPYKVPKEDGGIKLPGATKMEKVGVLN